MATIQSTTNTTVNTQPLPAATSKGTDSANATEATAKGVVASATQISVSVSSGAEDWLVSPVAYGLGQNPPLSGEAASQALNQFFTELQTLPSSQKEILLNDLMNFLLDAFRLFKKSNMQTRAAELTNQYQATLASADKLMKAAKETKDAGVATAVFGIIAGGLSMGTAGMGFKSTLNSSKLVSQYKVNNQEITAKTNQLQTLPKKPAVDGTGANAGAQSKSAMRTEIKNLNDAQSTLTRQIDLGNSQAQALTQGGTAAAAQLRGTCCACLSVFSVAVSLATTPNSLRRHCCAASHCSHCHSSSPGRDGSHLKGHDALQGQTRRTRSETCHHGEQASWKLQGQQHQVFIPSKGQVCVRQSKLRGNQRPAFGSTSVGASATGTRHKGERRHIHSL